MQDVVVSASQLIDDARWSAAQKLAAIVAACAITFDGLDIQILSFAVPQIASQWHLPKSSFAIIFATSLLAVAAGTLLGGQLGDRLGRRKAIGLSVGWFGLFTVLLSTSNSLPMLFVYRLLSGLGIGAAIPNAAAYVSEITPARVRTALLSATIVCIPLGGVVGGVLAAHILPVSTWRTLVLIGGILPVLLALVVLLVLPESPRFLAANASRQDKALRVFERFGIAVPVGAVVLEPQSPHASDGTAIASLLGLGYRRDTLSLWCAFCFCLISVYMVFNWLPSLLTNVGLGSAAASNDLAMYNLCGIVGALLLGLWINRSGSRMPLMLAGTASIASALWIALTLPVNASTDGLLRWQIGLHGFLVNGVQTALYAIAAHIYPTRLRARGVAAASAFGRCGAVVSAFVGGSALHYAGSVYFYILAITLTGTLAGLQFLRRHIEPANSSG